MYNPIFYATLFKIAKTWKSLSLYRWISDERKCETHIHIHTKITAQAFYSQKYVENYENKHTS